MSRQASPAPQPSQQHPSPRPQHPPEHSRRTHSQHDGPMSTAPGPTFVVGMPNPQQVQLSASTSSSRGKGKAYPSGITASAEDVKYAAKYRDLKKKVKEIEADNDKLLFKVMQAKRNIQRAKLERAILYERLGTVPASPPPNQVALPPHQLPVPAGAVLGPGVVPDISPHGPLPPPGAHGIVYEQQLADPRLHHRHDPQPVPPGSVQMPPPERRTRAPRDPSYPRKRPHIEAGYGGSPPPSPPPAGAHSHVGQLPITHTQRVVTIQTPDGLLQVIADTHGQPVLTADGSVIPVSDPNAPQPPPLSGRRRGGRSAREPAEVERREHAILPGPGPAHSALEPHYSASSSRSHSAGGAPPPQPGAQGGQMSPPLPNVRGHGHAGHAAHHPNIAPREAAAARERELELQREYEHDRELRDRERERQGRHEIRGRHAHTNIHGHAHPYLSGEPLAPSADRDRSRRHDLHELAGSPPPPQNNIPVNSGGRGEQPLSSNSQPSPIQGHVHAHRSNSMQSHHSHHSHHSHGHRSHSHSHSGSPMNSPTDGRPYQGSSNMRIHGHQRIGPGTNINREVRDHDAEERDERTSPAPVHVSRVPTPPYMRTTTATGAVKSANAPPLSSLRENDDRDVEMDAADPQPSSVRSASRVSSFTNASANSVDEDDMQERATPT